MYDVYIYKYVRNISLKNRKRKFYCSGWVPNFFSRLFLSLLTLPFPFLTCHRTETHKKWAPPPPWNKNLLLPLPLSHTFPYRHALSLCKLHRAWKVKKNAGYYLNSFEASCYCYVCTHEQKVVKKVPRLQKNKKEHHCKYTDSLVSLFRVVACVVWLYVCG